MRRMFLSLPLTCCMILVGCGHSSCDGDDCGHDSSHVSHQVQAPLHVHPTEGPHHGDLVELGNEEFHAEIVHDEQTEMLTVYLLGTSAVHAVGSKALELKINLSHDGVAEQFTLGSTAPAIRPPRRIVALCLSRHRTVPGTRPRPRYRAAGRGYPRQTVPRQDRTQTRPRSRPSPRAEPEVDLGQVDSVRKAAGARLVSS